MNRTTEYKLSSRCVALLYCSISSSSLQVYAFTSSFNRMITHKLLKLVDLFNNVLNVQASDTTGDDQ